jgi:hypothetical protein
LHLAYTGKLFIIEEVAELLLGIDRIASDLDAAVVIEGV